MIEPAFLSPLPPSVPLLTSQGMRTGNVQGLPCIYPRNPFTPKVTSANTAVAHHERSPEFHEEVCQALSPL
jgi:hypothetical protein